MRPLDSTLSVTCLFLATTFARRNSIFEVLHSPRLRRSGPLSRGAATPPGLAWAPWFVGRTPSVAKVDRSRCS
ncbi:hypothetical protein PsYK624_088390 [Phanerochaete sordida]|uniref:Uncharacterized protein n=1 Tax=Phanerochaete sordida TaxID=48140 RepID=A0A9P3GE53_9APHY|nr:hypothetical protein PsYK624_088390 [Phanerochaete sordida]